MLPAWLGCLIVCVVWASIYLPALGTRELQGEEARRVLPGRTMLQTGDWIVPRSAGKIYNRKPPLVNWAAAAAIRITGRMDEWTVRMPSVLAILVMALCVFWFARAWLQTSGALFAAIASLANIGFIEKGRLIEIEALYMALFGIALVLWMSAWWRDRRWLAWLGSMLVLGVGFLAKGPVHVWYFYAIVFGILAAEKRLRELLSWRHWAGLALFVLVWLPWVLANSGGNPQKDSGKVWAEQITHRLGFVEFSVTDWLLQIPQSLVNFLPWALLLPLAWDRRVIAQWDSLGRRGVWIRGLRNGLVVGFLVIALLPSSRPRFMLPLNVAAALLIADILAMVLPDRWRRFTEAWPAWVNRLGATMALGATVWVVFGSFSLLSSWNDLAAKSGADVEAAREILRHVISRWIGMAVIVGALAGMWLWLVRRAGFARLARGLGGERTRAFRSPCRSHSFRGRQ